MLLLEGGGGGCAELSLLQLFKGTDGSYSRTEIEALTVDQLLDKVNSRAAEVGKVGLQKKARSGYRSR